MKKCYLDSNFLVYFLNRSIKENKLATSLLDELTQNQVALFISPLVLDEFLHAVRLRLELLKSKKVWHELEEALEAILDIPVMSIVNPPVDTASQGGVIGLMRDFHLRPRDAYHLLTMQANSIDGFATFDNDFSTVFDQKALTKA